MGHHLASPLMPDAGEAAAGGRPPADPDADRQADRRGSKPVRGNLFVFLIARGDRLVTIIPLSAHIGGITPSLPKRTAPLVKEPSD
jgi:hypothetical protein